MKLDGRTEITHFTIQAKYSHRTHVHAAQTYCPVLIPPWYFEQKMFISCFLFHITFPIFSKVYFRTMLLMSPTEL